MLRRLVQTAVVALALFSAVRGYAQVQTKGQQVYPGKFTVGLHPLGFQVQNDVGSGASGLFKLSLDFGGLVRNTDKLGIWVVGQLGYSPYSVGTGFFGPAYYYHDVQLSVLAILTFEKLVNIPLVPEVIVGWAFDFLLYPGGTGVAFGPRFGGGFHYYLTKNVGLGVESAFTIGPAIRPSPIANGVYFSWDMLFGARFNF